jgi:phosphatidylserine decarboxylase
MSFTRWGIVPLIVPVFLTLSLVSIIPWNPWGLLVVCLASPVILFILWFFRNPHRFTNAPIDHLIAPSDGVIADIEEIEEPSFIGTRALRIGIFMSVFDVHINRSPASGIICYQDYHVCGFLDARNIDAKRLNESNTLGMTLSGNVRILVRQIAGRIARRIVCTHILGDTLERGEIFGMIRFGSRTEVWVDLQADPQALVCVGQRVKGGVTPIFRVPRQTTKAPL